MKLVDPAGEGGAGEGDGENPPNEGADGGAPKGEAGGAGDASFLLPAGGGAPKVNAGVADAEDVAGLPNPFEDVVGPLTENEKPEGFGAAAAGVADAGSVSSMPLSSSTLSATDDAGAAGVKEKPGLGAVSPDSAGFELKEKAGVEAGTAGADVTGLRANRDPPAAFSVSPVFFSSAFASPPG